MGPRTSVIIVNFFGYLSAKSTAIEGGVCSTALDNTKRMIAFSLSVTVDVRKFQHLYFVGHPEPEEQLIKWSKVYGLGG